MQQEFNAKTQRRKEAEQNKLGESASFSFQLSAFSLVFSVLASLR
jgi:hypothetical protein